MTSKALIYYSLKGNTKGIVDAIDWNGYDVFNINKDKLNLNGYDSIIIGTSTYGRGAPPPPFFRIKAQLVKLKNKRIGLFGSGRSEYEYFCGALDVIEEVLKPNNHILFNFKFEGFPRNEDVCTLKNLLKEV